MPILDEILQYASVPVIVKPNAGLPKQKDGEVYYDVEPEEFGRFMAEILKRGASLIGGCCGTTPHTSVPWWKQRKIRGTLQTGLEKNLRTGQSYPPMGELWNLAGNR